MFDDSMHHLNAYRPFTTALTVWEKHIRSLHFFDTFRKEIKSFSIVELANIEEAYIYAWIDSRVSPGEYQPKPSNRSAKRESRIDRLICTLF